MPDKTLWSLIALVNTKNRKEVLLSLDKPDTPTLLAKKLKIHRSVVSRVLLFMEKQKIVKCLNPENKVNRFYYRTTLGNNVCRKVREM